MLNKSIKFICTCLKGTNHLVIVMEQLLFWSVLWLLHYSPKIEKKKIEHINNL